jgi:DnaJ family protein B protein 12
MSAKASGADAGGGTAKSREHNQGNQERKYTVEQKAAVIRVRRCAPTAFYEILDLESVRTSCSESDIKKAYRKLSLLTHPDKNGHEHADEAFKMVSRAFGVLGDPEKRAKYDKFGGDPDSRFGGGAAQSSGFSGFAQRPSAGGAGGARGFGGGWDEEISPEEMFQRFFGGRGMGGGFGGPFGGTKIFNYDIAEDFINDLAGGGLFDGPQFVFNMGGGPGIRVHQFGGARPRRRPAEGAAQQQQEQSLWQSLVGLLPIIILLILPLFNALFSGEATSSRPDIRWEAIPPHTQREVTNNWDIPYFVRPHAYDGKREGKIADEKRLIETLYLNDMKQGCQRERDEQKRLIQEASGIFWLDQEKMKKAKEMPMPSCQRARELNQRAPQGL